MKRFWIFMVSMVVLLGSAQATLTHGSLHAEGVNYYPQGTGGGDITKPAQSATADIKVVTIGTRSWGWIKTDGSKVDTGADWCTQLRYWSATNGKTENNLLVRNALANQATEVWGSTTKAEIGSCVKISFFNNLTVGGQSETPSFPYLKDVLNSKDDSDVASPVLTSYTTGGVAETTVTFSLSATDNSNQFFFLVEDAAAGIQEVLFRGSETIAGLSPNTNYNFKVTPIDFSGNEGVSQIIAVRTAGLNHIDSGIAKDIKFVLKSNNGTLEYYYELVDASKSFREAFLKYSIDGGVTFKEVKPTVSPDRLYCQGTLTDAAIAGKVLTLNLGYMVYAEPIVWEDYVMDNKFITSGVNAGLPIVHQMGGFTASETVAPTLTEAKLVDVTADYVKIHVEGADDSGVVYYEIAGAETGTVNRFRTGDIYLPAAPNKLYNYRVVAKDLSGNYSAPIEFKARTMKARSQVLNGTRMGYNTTAIQSTPGGELQAIIGWDGNNLTIGVTTSNTELQAGASGKLIHSEHVDNYKPTVRINGVDHPLVSATEDLTATTLTAVFSGSIGDVALAEGTSITLRWSVFWAAGNGNFFTGTYNYTIGDHGQVDTEGPEELELTLTDGILSWPAGYDFLSGVKAYTVEEHSYEPVMIADLGQEQFSYTMQGAGTNVSVTAIDFVGNETKTIYGIPSSIPTHEASVVVYPNPTSSELHISGVEVEAATILSTSGQLVSISGNTNHINVRGLSNGLYIVAIKSTDGQSLITKFEKK